MRSRLISLATTLIVLLGTAAARADNLAPFNAAMEDVAAHNRAALADLADDDFDRAAAELGTMQASWGAFAQHFGRDRPNAFRDNKLYVNMLVDVPTRIVAAMIMINFGRPVIARKALLAIRDEMSAVRRASGVEVLADAVLDANARMAPLAAYRDQPPDWSTPAAAAEIAATAAAYGGAISRCEALAPEPVRAAPEFRRIVAGIRAALADLPQAVAARDGDRLQRVIAALQAFDTRLAARYG